MAILLLVLMVVAVLVFEFLRRRKETVAAAAPETEAEIVHKADGFAMPLGLSYHPLHTWARPLDAQTVVVGLDDFGCRLVGRINMVLPPMTGIELEQGQSSALLRSGNRIASVVAPIGGEIVEVNKELRERPELISEDPYGRGWLFKIRSWRLAEQLSGLLAGSAAKRWMEDSAQRLRLAFGRAPTAAFQDGGEPLEDIGSLLGRGEWINMVREFLGTEAKEG